MECRTDNRGREVTYSTLKKYVTPSVDRMKDNKGLRTKVQIFVQHEMKPIN